MSETSDHILLRRAAGGDHRAFATLMQRRRRQLLALIRRELDHVGDIEDVWQDTLLSSWLALRKQPEVRHPFAWLCQIARNRCRDRQRSDKAWTRAVAEAGSAQHFNRAGRVRARPSEAGEQLAELLKAAPGPAMRTARLFYLEEMSVAEIAEREHLSVGTVKRRLFTARRQLRQSPAVAQGERGNNAMAATARKRTGHSFPDVLPQITITPSRAKLSALAQV